MGCAQASKRCRWKRFPHLIEVWLLIISSFLGCFHAPQVTEDNETVSHSEIRPIDIDASTAGRIGHEALEKVGYEEIIKLAEKAGFVEYKSRIRIQLASYGSEVTNGFAPVFSRYAVAAAVASQADSPLPGPADIAAVGVVVVGLVDAGLLDGYLLDTVGEWLRVTSRTLLTSSNKGVPKPSPNFELPTNPPQLPPAEIPPGWRIRQMPPTGQYPNGYWKLEKPMKDGSWQPMDPSTMKPGSRPQTHIEFPAKKPE